ncbi:MAG TPA: aspartate aminotransferase family protein [Pseudomonadaceae bacterium]|nr:aspartate aminotransferase family protein [Pseudomonadaceae bacterium]
MDTITTEDTLGIAFSRRLPLAFSHGTGSRVWDEHGKVYLDFTSGWGVNSMGHAHPVMVQALTNQASKLIQGPNAAFTYSPVRASLLQTMRTVLPGHLSRIYFCNSGAEANDAVLKLARKMTGRSEVISTLGSFHGRSLATLSVSRGPDNPARFLPPQQHTRFVPHGDIAALEQALSSDTAALIVEPVQGEGGVRIPPMDWLAKAERLCRQHGALLILDEVQTGFCRTGRFFAHQHSPEPIRADIITMAKGIAGGFPFAAFAVSESVYEGLQPDDHGGTYNGNPLGCAVADVVIRYLRDKEVATRVASLGERLITRLHALHAQHPGIIQAIRGQGLLTAMELHDQDQVRNLAFACADAGLLVVPTRNGVIRLLPDLLVSEADLDAGLDILTAVLAAHANAAHDIAPLASAG